MWLNQRIMLSIYTTNMNETIDESLTNGHRTEPNLTAMTSEVCNT